MAVIDEMLHAANEEGFFNESAESKVCQDIVLKALAESSFNRNVTIKGGVVMRSITKSARRATQDMDIDFIRYSLNDDSIRLFIDKLNCLPDIRIEQSGEIEELRQEDYFGKRVHIIISDSSGKAIESKVDIGVHKHMDIAQEEFCFDIAWFEDGANLLINSREQMFVEKLRSLLKFGANSTRFKDIFDLCYLSDSVDRKKLETCLETFVFLNSGMRENSTQDVVRRVENTFSNPKYVARLSTSRKNWLDMPVEEVLLKLKKFLRSLSGSAENVSVIGK